METGTPNTSGTGTARLSLPPVRPTPVDNCDVCTALAVQRAEARSRGDYSAETDCNVEIAAHAEGHC
ncbi:hypothetical protein [Streptomyces sp. XD-27]|uniref:hypothetical protein n=1 Tax=Streptomyces sp. XD-27 TaxID=3062779 RepID=UPI0026F42789|nr:hypothetical protein [Streptomyces sp. XD-27]WKX71242.1 hypothetical protein Q3Y56_16220 [Streptomyces sp. XD-27]